MGNTQRGDDCNHRRDAYPQGWALCLRPAFLAGQYVKPVTATVWKLSFIHSARWAIIKGGVSGLPGFARSAGPAAGCDGPALDDRAILSNLFGRTVGWLGHPRPRRSRSHATSCSDGPLRSPEHSVLPGRTMT